MTLPFDRRLEFFSERVKLNIDQSTTEMQRLNTYLNSLKSEIIGIQDQIKRVRIQSHGEIEEKRGKKIRLKLNAESKLSLFKAKLHSEIQKIESEQAKILAEIGSDFEKSIKNIEKQASSATSNFINDFDGRLEAVKNQIARFSLDTSEFLVEEEDYTAVNTMRNKKITQLENIINEKEKERIRELTLSKQKLTECLNRIEQQERQHGSKMESLKNKLKSVDQKYNRDSKSMNDERNRNHRPLQKKLNDLSRKYETLKDSIQKIEGNRVSKFEEISQKREEYSSMIKIISDPTEHKSQSISEDQSSKLSELRKKLEQKNIALIHTRKQNDTLIRNIAQLKHNLRVAKRKTELNF